MRHFQFPTICIETSKWRHLHYILIKMKGFFLLSLLELPCQQKTSSFVPKYPSIQPASFPLLFLSRKCMGHLRAINARVDAINLQFIFELMYKTKPIAKNYPHRQEKTPHQKSLNLTDPATDSDQELFQRLLHEHCQCAECNPHDDPFINQLLLSLQHPSDSEEESPNPKNTHPHPDVDEEQEEPAVMDAGDEDEVEQRECSEDESPMEVSYDYRETSSYALARINAQYMRKMGSVGADRGVGRVISFDSTVRVKFFNDQLAVSELCHAQQYITTFQQYYQTSSDDEDRHMSDHDQHYP